MTDDPATATVPVPRMRRWSSSRSIARTRKAPPDGADAGSSAPSNSIVSVFPAMSPRTGAGPPVTFVTARSRNAGALLPEVSSSGLLLPL